MALLFGNFLIAASTSDSSISGAFHSPLGLSRRFVYRLHPCTVLMRIPSILLQISQYSVILVSDISLSGFKVLSQRFDQVIGPLWVVILQVFFKCYHSGLLVHL